jgi:hypothetical protein
MEVRKTRHVDSDEPDENGYVSYYFEYDIYEFVQSELCLVARSYTDTPQEANFLRKEVSNQQLMLTIQDFSHPLMLLALENLKADGKSEIKFLSEASGGYSPIPVGT